MQPALEVAEQHGHSLDSFFVGEIFETVFLNLVRRDAVPALLLCLEVKFFQFVVGQCQEIAQFVSHGNGSVSFAIGR